MKELACTILAFAAGLLVGTAGSDDTLLIEAREREATAYERGLSDASAKFQAVAVQRGFANWVFDPHVGHSRQFIWKPSGKRDSDGSIESFAITGWPDHRAARLP